MIHEIKDLTHPVTLLSLRPVKKGDPLPPKPRITANRVTMIRLALLPLGGWLIYQGVQGQWVALGLLTLLGCTDFVDGYLARKHGPTVLGGLMDPIADKVFITVVFLPMTDPRIGWLEPFWVTLLLIREFVVTSARTSYQRRGITLHSTYLAKIKTWEQMCAGAFFFFAHTLPSKRAFMALLVAAMVLSLIGAGIYWLVRRRFWRGAFIFSGTFVALTLLALFVDQKTWAHMVLIGTTVFTWYTGGAYFTKIRSLIANHPIDALDLSRLGGALVLPVLALALLALGLGPAWALITLICIEFALGGLDNLLVHVHRLPSALSWGSRVGGEALLLGTALAAPKLGMATAVPWLVYGAMGIALVTAALLFFRERGAYLPSGACVNKLP